MTRIAALSLTALILALPAPLAVRAATAPGRVCLNASEIQRTETPNDRTLIFHMRDGKVWRNSLKTVCPMLATSPFSQRLHAGDLICANQQIIHVERTGADCTLGDFTPVTDTH
jgi:hypothetical protein